MRRLAGVGVLAVVGLITTCFVATWVSLGSSQQWWGNSTVSSSSDEQGREESRERLAGGPFADEWEHTRGVMVHTKEYQVKLRSFDWEDRKAQAKRFLHKMKELSEGMFPFSWSASQEDVREQYHLGKISNCGRKHALRLRRYVWGHQLNTSSLDCKMSSREGRDSVFQQKIGTSETHLATSIHKFEQGCTAQNSAMRTHSLLSSDIHPCRPVKWSQEFRVTDVPFDKKLCTCKDLLEYFPELWNGKTEDEEAPVSQGTPEIWWQLEQHGRLADKTMWKSAVTLKYNSIAEAIAGVTEPLPRYVAHRKGSSFSQQKRGMVS